MYFTPNFDPHFYPLRVNLAAIKIYVSNVFSKTTFPVSFIKIEYFGLGKLPCKRIGDKSPLRVGQLVIMKKDEVIP